MKTLFIINPKSGKAKSTARLDERIKTTLKELSYDGEIYYTKAKGDATDYVRRICEQTDEEIRVFACGGDGTFSEVVNGAIGFPHVAVGVIPKGTGNDFCRNFPHDFTDIKALLTGKTHPCDAIRYTFDGKTGYAANMVNIGFDCNAADMAARLKRYPFISGSLAYLLGVFAVLIRKKGADLKIDLDGETLHNGPLLLTSLANGSYCGGGIKSNPLASVTDGKINVNIIYNISRFEFLKKFPHYVKGTHINLPGIEKIINTTHCKTCTITPNNGTVRISVDGEIITATQTTFQVIPGAFNLILPQNKIFSQMSVLLDTSNDKIKV